MPFVLARARGCLALMMALLLSACGDRQATSLAELAGAGYALNVAEYHRAAREGDVKALALFLKAGVKPDIQNRRGETALFHAAGAGKLEVVEWLMAQGCNVQQRTTDGTGVLHAAVEGGSSGVVEMLMKAGLQPESRDPLLVLSARLGHLELCQMLLRHCRSQLDEAFLEAAASGRTAVVDYLLKQGADPFASRSPDGLTALMLAAQQNQDRMVDYLLANGANRFAQDAEGRCAYAFAASAGAERCASLLATPVTLDERDLGLVEDGQQASALREVQMGAAADSRPAETSDNAVKPLADMAKSLGPADAGQDVLARLRLRSVREAMAPLMISAIGEEKVSVLLLGSGGTTELAPGSEVAGTGWRLLAVNRAPANSQEAVLPPWMYPHVELRHATTGLRRIGLTAVPIRAGETRALLEMQGRSGSFEARVGDKVHLNGALQPPWQVVSISPASVGVENGGHFRQIGPQGVLTSKAADR